jgi:hypothetical protein
MGTLHVLALVLFYFTLLRPIHTFKPTRYKWHSAIDNATGLASSIETTNLLNNDGTIRQVIQRFHDYEDMNGRSCCEKVRKIFAEYPEFLKKKSLSFGLLATKKKKSTGVKEVCVPVPFIKKRPLLIFGKGATDSFTISSSTKNTTQVVTEIPIIGGILNCNCQGNNSDIIHNNGRLRFEYIHEQGTNTVTSQMITSIINYQPAIVGCAPHKNIRKDIYLCVQSPIHAYVMWRFHHHCIQEIKRSND